MSTSTHTGKLCLLVSLSAMAACTAPGGPDRIRTSTFDAPSPDAGGGGTNVDASGVEVLQGQLSCAPVQSSEGMTPRSTILTGVQHVAAQPTYFTRDLFTLFKTVCGGCHVENSIGGFSVKADSFVGKVTPKVLSTITSDEPSVFMPPAAGGGLPFSQRSTTDAVVQLATLLKLWLDQGSSPEAFNLPVADEARQEAASYALSPELGGQLTNIGSCVPGRSMVGASTKGMDELDAFFATTDVLPTTLDKTDLVTLESGELARGGVISYAPTYPLWTDDAGKMRYVRVPRGKSIVFDKATQTFQIPPNTRFYKTFLKRVIDASGAPGYRKIETRLIVSRPDATLPDGTATQTALFGTYIWNDDESQASLLTDPLRDGKPFADRVFVYLTDEAKAQSIIDAQPRNLSKALERAGVSRHYAVPGSGRCVQCHQGSPSQSFVLGFTPLQIARRETDTGGVYEPAVGDELTQLQRLIDYGVIGGMTSPSEVLPLEQSQGMRTPRTAEELKAQAYMIGNCAHCHNSRGFPSVRQPLLKDRLNFLPGPGTNQGIFQFPLELRSPVRKRGLFQDLEMVYITPSLYDLPREEATAKFFCPAGPDGSCNVDLNAHAVGEEPPAPPAIKFVLAPWRSLIYRNVETPYDYFDDSAVFSHMPLNSVGYDCRVGKLMAEWMVSIPAKLKDPTKLENAIPQRTADGTPGAFGDKANRDIQPYVEVRLGDADYSAAVQAANARLAAYRNEPTSRRNFCPNTYTADIIDPVIEDAAAAGAPVSGDISDVRDPADMTKVVMPAITPVRPHFVPFDGTDPPGDWFPRRPDWEKALVTPNIPAFIGNAVKNEFLSRDAAEDLQNVLEALRTVRFTKEIREALLEEVPFGLWDTSTPGCNFAGIPTVATLAGGNQPRWIKTSKAPADAPVYFQSAGASVFTTICFNCHGLQADSRGLLADQISSQTGGSARVANFRDGLFGPVGSPGANRERVFGPAATALGDGLTGDDLAARYLAWMALGGTSKHLPTEILDEVALTPVLGKLRAHLSPNGTPDMLRLGLTLCQQVATSSPDVGHLSVADFIGRGDWNWSQRTGLIDSSGDADMWLKLCSLGNRPLVRVLRVDLSHHNGKWAADTSADNLQLSGSYLFWGTNDQGVDMYGANPAMDHVGNVTNGLSGNVFPVCVEKPADIGQLAWADAFLGGHHVNGNVIPYCPPDLLSSSNQLKVVPDPLNYVDGRKWAARGAMNAALAVFLYLDQMEREPAKRRPLYNQCDLLKAAP